MPRLDSVLICSLLQSDTCCGLISKLYQIFIQNLLENSVSVDIAGYTELQLYLGKVNL